MYHPTPKRKPPLKLKRHAPQIRLRWLLLWLLSFGPGPFATRAWSQPPNPPSPPKEREPEEIDLGKLVQSKKRTPAPSPRRGASPTSKPSRPSKGNKPTKDAPRNDADDSLKTIVITGSRRARELKETVVTTEVITRKQIAQTSARRLSDILATHTGIQIDYSSSAGAGVQLQGLDSKYILILVDGQRINGRVRGVLDLDRFPLSQIERIEIIKGATSALYGADAIGGVIHIITRRSKKPLFTDASLRYGYGDSHLLDLAGTGGFSWRGWSGLVSLSWSRYDAWDRDPTDLATTGSNDNQIQANANASYRFSSRLQLTARADYQFRDRAGIDTNSVGAIYDRSNRTETATASIFLNALLGSTLRLRWRTSMSYFRDQFLYEQRNGTTPPTLEQTYDWLLQSVLQADLAIGTSHFLSFGIDALYERLQTPRIENELADRGRLAFFAQYEWILSKPIRISLVPGLRVGYDTQYGPAINPKIAVRIDPIPKLALRASYGWGFRAPDFKDLYLQFENSAVGYTVIGNPQLKPETSRSLQIGLEWSGLSWMIARANYYRNDLEQLINTTALPSNPNEPLRFTYRNIDAALTQGIEAQIVFLYRSYFQMAFSYTYLHSEDLSTQQPLLGRAAHQGNFFLTVAPPVVPLRLTIRGTLTGPRPVEDDANGDGVIEKVDLPAYLLLHARLSYAFWHRRVELFAAVENILDAGDSRWLPIRPRTFFVGLRFQYASPSAPQ